MQVYAGYTRYGRYAEVCAGYTGGIRRYAGRCAVVIDRIYGRHTKVYGRYTRVYGGYTGSIRRHTNPHMFAIVRV